MCKLVRPRVYLSQKSNGSSPPASFFPPLRFPEVTKSRMKLHKLSITVHCVWLHISVAIYSPWLHGPQSTDKGLRVVAAYPSGKAQCTADWLNLCPNSLSPKHINYWKKTAICTCSRAFCHCSCVSQMPPRFEPANLHSSLSLDRVYLSLTFKFLKHCIFELIFCKQGAA